MLRSLLSAYEIEENVWTISYNDVVILRHRLDLMGLVEGRTIGEDAFSFITWIHSQRVRNEEIKKGINNQHIEGTLVLAQQLKTTLYTDQMAAVAFAVNNRRVGIFDEMGVGKSLEMLASVVALGAKVRRTLIVCPYTVQIGLVKEISKHTHLKALPVPNGRKRALKFIKQHEHDAWDFMLVHPENLVASGGKAWSSEIMKYLMGMQWDMICVDEFHMYKNMDAKRTKCILALLNETRDREGKYPRAIVMTGTPVSESPMNAYVVLHALSRERVPHYTKFASHFEVRQDITYGKHAGARTHSKVTGYK
ncbi:MAG: hypothetical protein DRJ03_18640, partial [Chloroflexi bacterium]